MKALNRINMDITKIWLARVIVGAQIMMHIHQTNIIAAYGEQPAKVVQIMKVRHQMTIAEVRRRAESMNGADPLDFISQEGPQWTHSEHQKEPQWTHSRNQYDTHTEHHIIY